MLKTGVIDMTSLYRVITTARAWGYDDIKFYWFRDAAEPVDEMFTEEQATALKSYLDRQHGHQGETIIEKADPPSPDDMGLGDVPCGGPVDHYQLFREPAYDLPFRVLGFHDLREAQKSANSHVASEQM
jgi:hypothetical protein